ncbi:triose-phosphate isomerase [Porphyrobacter sp. GA68]|uniref:triose-phosphate isomerase n=1 Tax=Porphyrobacter sp. GA68 TaxID=2883480 RepID=UPI001D1949CC|nr:triose-phosphate isomerase [Porphyrobacter sp. GA68]
MPIRPLVVGNWKMNGTRAMLSEARAIDRAAQRIGAVDVALAPPYTLLHAVQAEAEQISVGAQDCSANDIGAFTGDIAASMIADVGAKFVLLGHSERRQHHGEDSALLTAKCRQALAAGLQLILCCGESAAVRDEGKEEGFVLEQLQAILPQAGEFSSSVSEVLTVAYEPVWAIGTGRTASSDDISAMHNRIRALLVTQYGQEQGEQVRILYGGSVKPENAGEILALPDVNGALVGGASLSAQSFMGIVLAATGSDAE